MITKSTVKSKYNFTDKMIKELLPEPKLVKNPHYSSGPEMCLWDEDIVIEVTKTDKYNQMLEQKVKRKNGAQKAVVTKKNKLKEQIDLAIKHLNLPRKDINIIKKETIQAKEDWYDYIAFEHNQYFKSNCKNVDKQTMKRWMVNYIRHNLLEYDEDIYDMHGKVGISGEYIRYKNAVLDKIAEVYPELQDECERQKIGNN